MMESEGSAHEVVLYIDVSAGNPDDGPLKDHLFIRSKSPKERVSRYVYTPGQEGPPVADPEDPVAGPFLAELRKLARHNEDY